jgi:hypothetical protein
MRLSELAARLEADRPDASPVDHCQLCLLISQAVPDLTQLRDDTALHDASRDAQLRIQLAFDQYGAVTEELRQLGDSDPARFDKDQIWVLLRAIKVQDQLVKLLLGGSPLNV